MISVKQTQEHIAKIKLYCNTLLIAVMIQICSLCSYSQLQVRLARLLWTKNFKVFSDFSKKIIKQNACSTTECALPDKEKLQPAAFIVVFWHGSQFQKMVVLTLV